MTEPSRPASPVTVDQVAGFLEQFAPLSLAADWDNVGLLLGDRSTPLERLMTCLTVTPEVAAEAIDERVGCMVSHHPIFFRAAKRLTAESPEGRMLLALIRAGVALYSPHTAFDNTAGGINDVLARRLGLTEVQPLRRRPDPGQYKVVVFVPDTDLTRVADAMFEAGAGRIGQYSQCSFRLAGTGTFFGSDAANPTVGQKGRREEVSEWRLEVLCPANNVERVLSAMRRTHSYEEPAFDVYPLYVQRSPQGEGRLGRLPQRTCLEALAQTVKTQLKASLVQMVGEPDRLVERVAIVCGAGGDFVPDALQAGAHLLLTGEIRFHDCLAAQAAGLSVLLPGHYATERCGVEDLAARLQAQWPALTIWASRRERDPLHPHTATV